MKVYILLEEQDYAPATLYGVFSSLEKAQEVHLRQRLSSTIIITELDALVETEKRNEHLPINDKPAFIYDLTKDRP